MTTDNGQRTTDQYQDLLIEIGTEEMPPKLLAGLAEMGAGLVYFLARLLQFGAGDVKSVTYEYGYTFCIVAGLLNMLIVLDAYDIATGRKE